MKNLNNMDTICAISTPQGIGGIAVLRVSGADAIAIVERLFHGRRHLEDLIGGQTAYGTIADLDDVVVTVFRNPHSFTGEDTVEISCHGSLYIQRQLLQILTDSGCRLARAGEFTQRAFLNGKIDLSQAEAVADIIAAENKAAHDLARNQLRGGISLQLKELRDKLLHFTSLIELELDFADHEELEFADRKELRQLLANIDNQISLLLNSFRLGNALKNGVPVAIIGATNAGKSTLLNALVGEERAIVSHIAGTTRDTIEDAIIIDGIRFRFIDTAGIRDTDNEIEEIGIRRSIEAAQKAEIILNVVDATQDNLKGDGYAQFAALQEILKNKTVVTLYNKSDLLKSDYHDKKGRDIIYISAKDGDLQNLKERLVEICRVGQSDNHTLISNVRHYQALQRALDAIKRVEQGLEVNLSGELLSLDLQDCLSALGEITGQISSQDVLDNIFKHFCIGK